MVDFIVTGLACIVRPLSSAALLHASPIPVRSMTENSLTKSIVVEGNLLPAWRRRSSVAHVPELLASWSGSIPGRILAVAMNRIQFQQWRGAPYSQEPSSLDDLVPRHRRDQSGQDRPLSARCGQHKPEESCGRRAGSYSIQVGMTGGEEDVDPSAFARTVSVGICAVAAPCGAVFRRRDVIPASRSAAHRSARQKAAALG